MELFENLNFHGKCYCLQIIRQCLRPDFYLLTLSYGGPAFLLWRFNARFIRWAGNNVHRLHFSSDLKTKSSDVATFAVI